MEGIAKHLGNEIFPFWVVIIDNAYFSRTPFLFHFFLPVDSVTYALKLNTINEFIGVIARRKATMIYFLPMFPSSTENVICYSDIKNRMAVVCKDVNVSFFHVLVVKHYFRGPFMKK